jgi:hypothetical protein
MNDTLKKKPKYQKRYMERKRMLCVCLDREADKEIISWMNKQESISDSVRSILRTAARKEKKNENQG